MKFINKVGHDLKVAGKDVGKVALGVAVVGAGIVSGQQVDVFAEGSSGEPDHEDHRDYKHKNHVGQNLPAPLIKPPVLVEPVSLEIPEHKK
jgi:hypothetical protein